MTHSQTHGGHKVSDDQFDDARKRLRMIEQAGYSAGVYRGMFYTEEMRSKLVAAVDSLQALYAEAVVGNQEKYDAWLREHLLISTEHRAYVAVQVIDAIRGTVHEGETKDQAIHAVLLALHLSIADVDRERNRRITSQ